MMDAVVPPSVSINCGPLRSSKRNKALVNGGTGEEFWPSASFCKAGQIAKSDAAIIKDEVVLMVITQLIMKVQRCEL